MVTIKSAAFRNRACDTLPPAEVQAGFYGTGLCGPGQRNGVGSFLFIEFRTLGHRRLFSSDLLYRSPARVGM